MAKELEEMGRHGLAKKTWSSYSTAERMLSKFYREKKMERKLPIPENIILQFIHWLAKKRELRAGTICSYLAGVRQLHISQGLPEPAIRTEKINLILKGLKHMEDKDTRKMETERKPITKDVMALLKKELRTWRESPTNQRLVWAVATNMLHGAFRVGELLCGKATEFDPDFDLLTGDIHSTDKANQFRLKCPKEDKKGKSTIVDVYATGGPHCPVRALQSWKQLQGHWPEKQPAFRWDNGRPFTQNQFRKIVNDRLNKHIENPSQVFCTHSFRIGNASRMGELGYDDDDVKAVGRWNSRAFEKYMKLPRTKRKAIAKLIKF